MAAQTLEERKELCACYASADWQQVLREGDAPQVQPRASDTRFQEYAADSH